MSKKGGTIIKIVAVLAGVAAVGTACYLYKDKIKEFFQKINLKDKIDTAKSFVTDKVLGTGDDDFFDDADFFDDDPEEGDSDNGNRGYTSINITADDADTEEETPADDTKEETSGATDATEEAAESEEEDDTPYENEGLSDVSEDEDVLAEQTSLDGSL